MTPQIIVLSQFEVNLPDFQFSSKVYCVLFCGGTGEVNFFINNFFIIYFYVLFSFAFFSPPLSK
jgi:hypothetical protein